MSMKAKDDILAVSVAVPVTVLEGDVVEITGHLAADKPSAEGSVKILGTCTGHVLSSHGWSNPEANATIATRFREMRDDRTAGEVVDVGPFVWNADMDVINYDPDDFVSVVGTGVGPFNIGTAAAGGTHTGSAAGPFHIASAVNDQFKVTTSGGGTETFTITPGPARTIANVVADLSAAVGFTAENSGGYLKLTAKAVADDLVVAAVANSAYVALGFTSPGPTTYSHVVAAGGSHECPSSGSITFGASTKILKMSVGSAGETQTVTFAESTITPANIAIAINSGTFDVTATVTNTTHVTIAATNPEDSLTLVYSGSNAWGVLGLTPASDIVCPVTPASAGTHTGNVLGPYNISHVINNQFKCHVAAEAPFTITLTPGAARTVDQVFADINTSTTTDITASKSGGFLKLQASSATKSLTIDTVANDDYVDLGITPGTYAPSIENNKFKVTVGTGSPQTFTLSTGATQTIDQVVTDFAAATGFVASKSSGHLKLKASSLLTALTIETVTGDCYSALGFTAPLAHDEAASHSPAAIAGLIIGLPPKLRVSGSIKGPFRLVEDSGDTVKVTVEGGGEQTFDLTPNLTTPYLVSADDICTEINLTATDFKAEAVNGRITFLVDDRMTDFTIGNGNANTILGLTPGITESSFVVTTLER